MILISYYIYALNEGEFIIAVSIDLKRAFETIFTQILLHKLSLYGIQDSVEMG
jgi:hypothetical protein